MKRIISLILAGFMLTGLTSCYNSNSKIKVGLICIHDEKSTYDQNFIDAMKEAQQKLGLSDDQILIKKFSI